jgi:protein gp37
MSANSRIEWTGNTWNPVRGCSKVSSGCVNCYAERFAERFRGVAGHPFEQGFDLRLVPEKLLDPLHWINPSFVFVNSMSDLFHAGVPDEFIVAAFEVMAKVNWHTYQVLTKRAGHMRELIATKLRFAAHLPHIWWGVTAENRQHGLPRLEMLRNSDVAVKFVSCEPLLEDLGTINLAGINWLIAGGESGPGARPMQEEWVLSLRDQCAAAKVPFFFKQWGGLQKTKNGSLLEGEYYKQVPGVQLAAVPPRGERHFIEASLLVGFAKGGIAALAA